MPGFERSGVSNPFSNTVERRKLRIDFGDIRTVEPTVGAKQSIPERENRKAP